MQFQMTQKPVLRAEAGARAWWRVCGQAGGEVRACMLRGRRLGESAHEPPGAVRSFVLPHHALEASFRPLRASKLARNEAASVGMACRFSERHVVH